MYAEAGMSVPLKTEDQVKANFDRLTKGQPKKYRINQMFIVKHIDGEYIVYDQITISQDFSGNEMTCYERIGYHEEPKFNKIFDKDTGEFRAMSVSGSETVYDIPATKENIVKILEGPDVIPTNTNFVLDYTNARYAGFTKEEFMNKSFDDMMFKFNNGYYKRETTKPSEDKVQQLKKDLIMTQKKEEDKGEQAIKQGAEPDQKELEEQIQKESKEAEEEEQQQPQSKPTKLKGKRQIRRV